MKDLVAGGRDCMEGPSRSIHGRGRTAPSSGEVRSCVHATRLLAMAPLTKPGRTLTGGSSEASASRDDLGSYLRAVRLRAGCGRTSEGADMSLRRLNARYRRRHAWKWSE